MWHEVIVERKTHSQKAVETIMLSVKLPNSSGNSPCYVWENMFEGSLLFNDSFHQERSFAGTDKLRQFVKYNNRLRR